MIRPLGYGDAKIPPRLLRPRSRGVAPKGATARAAPEFLELGPRPLPASPKMQLTEASQVAAYSLSKRLVTPSAAS